MFSNVFAGIAGLTYTGSLGGFYVQILQMKCLMGTSTKEPVYTHGSVCLYLFSLGANDDVTSG